MAISRGYCPNCDKEVITEIKSPSHLIHLVLTLFTFGLWLPVWIIIAIDPTLNCRECGARAGRSKARLTAERWAKYAAMAFFSTLILLVVLAAFRG